MASVNVFNNLGDLYEPTQGAAATLLDCVDWDRPLEVTHGQMDELAKSVARGLLKRGLKRGAAVAIVSENRTEFLAAHFGIMRAGMVSVPVNHKLPSATIEFVLSDSGAQLAICDRARRALLPSTISCVEFGRDWAAFLDPGEFDSVIPARHETAMILYTSGSTGRVKGVPLTHHGQLWVIDSRLRSGKDFRPERLLVSAPLYHMNALGTAAFAFSAKASMILLPRFTATHYLQSIERFRATWITSVPAMLAMAAREREVLATADLSSVRLVTTGSAPLSEKLIAEVHAMFPNAEISNVYGTTEAGPIVFGPHPEGRVKPTASVGWPRPGVEVRLVDARGEDAQEGVLWQRTPATMRGYLNLPDKTKEVLTSDGWYISGDIFRRDSEGAYTFVGRIDDMFHCGGENVYPGEIEQVLEMHEAVLQACVVPVPDEIKGEKPVAFVVLHGGRNLNADELKQYFLARAPAYQHPRRVTFLREMPLSGTGKIDRELLRKRALKES